MDSSIFFCLIFAILSYSQAQCPPPFNGILHCPNGPTGTIGDICTFSCNTGYQLFGAQNGTCLIDGTWSGGLSFCYAFNCPQRIFISNDTYVSLVGSTCRQSYLSQCRLSCRDGFNGEDVVYLCNVTNDPAILDWVPIGGVHSVCVRAHCPALMNGVLYCPNGDTGAIGDICTFSCNPGYELQGAQIGTCLMDYTWSGELRTCVPYSCPDRITTSNTSFVSLVNSTCGQTYSSRCRLYCLDGFVGEDVIYVCNITNNPTVVDWVPIGGVHSICERVQCPPPINGILHCPNGAASGAHGDICTFSCNPGYELQGALVGFCLADETWSGRPSCVPRDCPDRIPTTHNSIVSPVNSSCTLTYLSQCRIYCPDGLIGDDITYLCNITNNPAVVDWVPIDGVHSVCERVQCPLPINGILQCQDGAIGSYGDNCTFSCNPGYELQGAHSGTCLADQTWSGGLPSCITLHCPVRISTSNNIIVSLENSSCTLTYLSQCRLSCQDDFIGDDVTYLCNVTSDPGILDWVPIRGVHSVCEKVECPPPTNGVLYCLGGYKITATLGDSCIFSCNPGYKLQGSAFGTCLSDESWSGGVRSCTPLNCPDIISTSINTNVTLINSSCTLEYQSRCVLSCTEGFTGANVTYFCNATNVHNSVDWVPIGGHHLSCDNGASVASASTRKSSGSTYIPIIAGGVSGVILLITVTCIIVLLFMRKSCKRKASYIDNQGTFSMPSMVTGKFNPVYKDTQGTNCMETCKMPSSFQYGMENNDLRVDQSPRYDNVTINPNAQAEYEMFEPQKPIEQKEMEELYLEMNPVGKDATDEPLYDTIREHSNKEEPMYENSKTRYQHTLPANFKLQCTSNPYS